MEREGSALDPRQVCAEPPASDSVGRNPHLEAALQGDDTFRFDSQNPTCLFPSGGWSSRWLEMGTQSLERGLGFSRS